MENLKRKEIIGSFFFFVFCGFVASDLYLKGEVDVKTYKNDLREYWQNNKFNFHFKIAHQTS